MTRHFILCPDVATSPDISAAHGELIWEEGRLIPEADIGSSQLEFVCETLPAGAMTDYAVSDMGAPIVSARLKYLLDRMGVDNIQYFPATVFEHAEAKGMDGFYSANILGLSDIIDTQASTMDAELDSDGESTVIFGIEKLVLKSLQAQKNVFVEKPLCLNADELAKIEQVYHSERISETGQLMLGFNRRFAPHAVILKKQLAEGPMSMIYRINAGSIPADTWIQDADIGGGRIIGEVCHFVDFLTFMCGSLPIRVYASALPDPGNLYDTLTINLEFENKSVGTICYFANGSKKVAKEYIEVYQSGLTGIIRDFKQLDIFGGGKQERKKLLNQNKGQANMIKAFINRIKDGGDPLIMPEEIFAVTKTTFGIIESLQNHQAVSIDE